jgi:hypothetical protein
MNKLKGMKSITVLRILAWLTFLTHISIMWQTGILDGSGAGEAPRSVLFPLFSCNLSMYLLLALCFIKRGRIFDIIATAVAYAGFIGAVVSIADYLISPNWQSFEYFKSLISHIFLLLGSLWLFIKYVRVGIKNIIACLYYVGFCLVDTLILLWLLPDANPMWVRKPIIDGVEFLNGWNMGWIFLSLVLVFLCGYELIRYIMKRISGRHRGNNSGKMTEKPAGNIGNKTRGQVKDIGL